jgi:TolB-like protein
VAEASALGAPLFTTRFTVLESASSVGRRASFTNLSNDLEQGYFADGITDDLTTDLSRVADMLVISRNTAFT